MIYVYALPEKLSDGFAHPAKPITFMNVDWFNSPAELEQKSMNPHELMRFIAGKTYAQHYDRLLVLDVDAFYTLLVKFEPCDRCRNAGMQPMDICPHCHRIARTYDT